MLQVLHDDRRVKHLIIDNSYVKSGWMDDRHLVNYLENGWLPGLIELGLKGFCHLQAKSLLGGRSFTSFGRYMNNNFIKIARKLDREPFQYFPIETSEMDGKRSIDQHVRALALKKSHAILK
ncbi:MAG TPA: hypothetical protein PK926_07990 [Spirochaetota bacterium]|nr:hypothetical protein [Spirochaetota bacterium]HPI88551.1 hypothetical protein [Spirochaetota bacterium]HPR48031.1 hypothetical protein [Spirochaetota bacterium]